MAQGQNLHTMKTDNKKLILQLLSERGGLSRKELALLSGLTQAAVSKLTAELIRDGFVREGGISDPPRRAGRREIGLSFCLDEILIFGVYAELGSITFSVSDLSGRRLHQQRIPFLLSCEEIARSAESFLRSAGAAASSLRYTGLCVPGSSQNTGFSLWDASALKAAFENRFGLPAAVENNVRSFVLAQRYYGNGPLSDRSLFFKWGPGIGSAFFAGGDVLSGDAGDVAEIGHYIVDTSGRKCRCGRYGCLETVCGVDALLNETGFCDVQTLLHSEKTETTDLLDQKIDIVAVALTNTSTLLNAQRVVFFGAMFSAQAVADKLKKQMLRYNCHFTPGSVGLSPLNERISSVCPAAVCARDFFFSVKEDDQ